ncbi:tetratricopeptide repeat protein [Cryobacterium tagatosivorans]|uniref:Tetratricopeptide repeat protein n=1 Tax=Cryobacterium tagatosivorans TaxID=1259199 RepID=A0A4R8UBL2_9MICO|nr:tetratricopeptide repeat protein [Cryobacterium tagatosivorans]TFB48174.1 tetratricopeptide repeat protein [Cryobacterium tagatosivorans]
MTASSPISQTVLDSLWDFTDPAASAERFRSAAADGELDDAAAAVLATQAARALGLQGRFDEGHAVLDEVAGASDPASERASDRPSAHVLARVALERGRLLRSAGQAEESVPFFTLAAREAAAAGAQFLALDALHMLALSDAGHEEEWAAEGLLVLAKAADDRTRRWGVSLHNNLAWHLHDSGRPAEALTEFEAALAAATAVGTAEQRFIGRWAVARCLRTLGRTDEARAIQQELAAERPDDEFVRAELAELAPASGEQPTIES